MAQKSGSWRSRLPWLLPISLLAAAGILAFAAQSRLRSAEGRQPVQQQDPVVQTIEVQPKPIDIKRMGLGTVTPWQMINISPQVSGRIVAIPFSEGRDVREGQVLLQIDPRPFQAALDQAIARKAQDVANLRNTQKNLQRDQTLLQKGGFATQQTVDNETAQVQMLSANIEGDQAAIEAAQTNLDFTTVKSPFDGVASLRIIDLGNLVSPAAIVGTVTQIEPIAVDFTLPQSDLADVRSAMANGPPTVLVYDQSGEYLLAKGVLEVVNNQIDQSTGTIKLKARFDNTDRKLWPGAFVQGAVVVRTEKDALAIPSDAVQRGPDGTYVWLVGPDDIAHRQPVQIGEIQQSTVVISSGIKPGDRIVTAGEYNLTQGAHVAEMRSDKSAQTED